MVETYINELVKKSKIAQTELEKYNQEQIDIVVKTIGKTIYDNAEILSKEAVEETNFGTVAGKVAKHKGACAAGWYYLKDKISVGEIDRNQQTRLITYAKPIGVVACITPSTNPTSTIGSNAMTIVKGRNTLIIAPHPNAKKVCKHGVDLINEALSKIDAPENIVQIIEEPTMDLTQSLMKAVDVVVATGGPGMIKSAYSSGNPSYGVGPGNVQALIAPDYQDKDKAANIIANNRAYDNGVPCTCEQTVFFPKAQETEWLEKFQENGSFLIEDPETIELICSGIFNEDGRINPKFVGLTAKQIAQKCNFELPEDKVSILVKAVSEKTQSALNREKMCPVLQYIPYETFEEALAMAYNNLIHEGSGHSASLFTNDEDLFETVALKLPVSRLVINQRGGAASGGTLRNGLAPTMSLGCGSWGNNSISENLAYYHLLNKTKVAFEDIDLVLPSLDEMWED